MFMHLIFFAFHVIHGKCGQPFSPLKDEILFRINWPGSGVDLQNFSPPGVEYDMEDSFVMTSLDNEQYKCTVPSISSEEHSPGHDEIATEKSVHKLLAPVFKSGLCTYSVESYWTYEICHGKHVRQYHEERVRKSTKGSSSKIILKSESGKEMIIQKDGDDQTDLIKTTEYYLGYITEKIDKNGYFVDPEKLPITSNDVPKKKINGIKTPYYAVNMTGGTPCDLKSGVRRRSSILYVCGQDSHNNLISVAETSSCEYELIVVTPELCKNPLYQLKGDQVNEIQCEPLGGAPLKPAMLTKQLQDQVKDLSHSVKRGTAQNDDEPTKDDMHRVENTAISSLVDRSLLKEFLSGSYCLHGGSGWWRFEYCYGMYVRQYHDDRRTGRTTISVGRWDEERHAQWASKKSSKPVVSTLNAKSEKTVTQVAHFYGDGDVCEETEKSREVIVRMKCKRDAASPHSVSIYLLEPSVCSYILGVESLIFCDLLDSADDLGLLTLD